jgi:hypothetical protein
MLQENEVPYDGYGEVSILDDATLVIKVNGAIYINEVTGSFLVEDKDVLVYTIDPTELRLAESRGFFFLDRGGVQVAERGFRPGSLSFTSFTDRADKREEEPRYELEGFVGDLTLDFDAEHGVLSVSIIDSRTLGKAFQLSAPLRRYTQTAKARMEPIDRDTPDGGQIILEDPPSQSNCSVTCTHGSCSIACPPKMGCIAYCKTGGIPVCECGQSSN